MDDVDFAILTPAAGNPQMRSHQDAGVRLMGMGLVKRIVWACFANVTLVPRNTMRYHLDGLEREGNQTQLRQVDASRWVNGTTVLRNTMR